MKKVTFLTLLIFVLLSTNVCNAQVQSRLPFFNMDSTVYVLLDTAHIDILVLYEDLTFQYEGGTWGSLHCSAIGTIEEGKDDKGLYLILHSDTTEKTIKSYAFDDDSINGSRVEIFNERFEGLFFNKAVINDTDTIVCGLFDRGVISYPHEIKKLEIFGYNTTIPITYLNVNKNNNIRLIVSIKEYSDAFQKLVVRETNRLDAISCEFENGTRFLRCLSWDDLLYCLSRGNSRRNGLKYFKKSF